MENVNVRGCGCLRQYMHVYFFMACINHLPAAPSTALALLLSSIEISELPGCAVDVGSTEGFAARWFLESAAAAVEAVLVR